MPARLAGNHESKSRACAARPRSLACGRDDDPDHRLRTLRRRQQCLRGAGTRVNQAPHPAREYAHGRVETLILPVDTATAGGLLNEAVARFRPARLLLTGQAAGRNRLCLERIATNRRDFRTPDISGTEIRDGQVLEDGPETYGASWPDLEGAVAVMNAAGIPAAVSEDCGTHLCNQVLYLALHAAAAADHPYVATFLHVPLLPEQVIVDEPAAQRHPNCPYMPLEMSIRGVEVLLTHAAAMGAAA